MDEKKKYVKEAIGLTLAHNFVIVKKKVKAQKRLQLLMKVSAGGGGKKVMYKRVQTSKKRVEGVVKKVGRQIAENQLVD